MTHARGKPSQEDHFLKILKKLEVFTHKEAIEAGVSAKNLSRLVQRDLIIKLTAGVYQHPEASIEFGNEDFIIACKKFGDQSIIGGLSALFYHNLSDQPPGQVWIIVPHEKISSSRFYRCIRTLTDPDIGIIRYKQFRITNIERTLVESFRYASKIGLETAFRAAQLAIRQQLTTPAKIANMAKKLGLESSINKYWEVLITI